MHINRLISQKTRFSFGVRNKCINGVGYVAKGKKTVCPLILKIITLAILKGNILKTTRL